MTEQAEQPEQVETEPQANPQSSTRPTRTNEWSRGRIAFIVFILAAAVAAAFLMEWYISGLT